MNLSYRYLLCACGIIFLIIIFALYLHDATLSGNAQSIDLPNEINNLLHDALDSKKLNTLKKDKDFYELCIELSRKLTNSMRRIGQLTCERSTIEVSTNGGWCAKISGTNSSQHMTDLVLVTTLSNFLVGKKVASFGDGPGLYKKFILEKQKLNLYDAYDGAPFCEDTTEGRVKFLDLSVPVYHLPKYDWIISLEVAEHIPQEFESIFIDNLVRHSKEGIILSWSKIGQGGHSHVNNRDFEYVKIQMESRGLKHDPNATLFLKNGASFSWLINNINAYKFEK